MQKTLFVENIKVLMQDFIYKNKICSSVYTGEGSDPINQFNPTSFLCLSQAKTWISNVISCGLFCLQLFEVRAGCLFKLSFHVANKSLF